MCTKQRKTDLFKLIRHDLTVGLLHEWKKYLFAVVLFVITCAVLSQSVQSTNAMQLTNVQPTITDFFIWIFRGMDVYVPSQNNTFIIPVNWLTMHLYIAFLIGAYPTNDLYGTAQGILIRSRSRITWWISKLVWNALSVLAFYGVGFLTVVAFTGLSSGALSFAATPAISGAVFETIPTGKVLFVVLALPFLTSIAFSFMEMTLSFILKPLYSYVIVVALMVSSAFFFTPFLLGNHAMLLRNKLVLQNGIETGVSVVVTISIAVAAAFVGNRYFRKMDILDKV